MIFSSSFQIPLTVTNLGKRFMNAATTFTLNDRVTSGM